MSKYFDKSPEIRRIGKNSKYAWRIKNGEKMAPWENSYTKDYRRETNRELLHIKCFLSRSFAHSFTINCTVYTYVLLYSSIAQYRDSLFDFEVLHLLLRHSVHVAVCLSFAHSLVGWFCSICLSSVCCSPLIRQLFFENLNSLYSFECRIWCVKFHVYYSVKWDMRECI